MRSWSVTFGFLVIALAGACGAPNGDQKTFATEKEQLEGAQGISELSVQANISAPDVLGELCGVSHGCTWESLPIPEYPTTLGATEASCSVQLTVGKDGIAKDVVVECDDRRFNAVTRRAISSMKHSVTDACGRTCSIIGERIEYPIEYRLED